MGRHIFPPLDFQGSRLVKVFSSPASEMTPSYVFHSDFSTSSSLPLCLKNKNKDTVPDEAQLRTTSPHDSSRWLKHALPTVATFHGRMRANSKGSTENFHYCGIHLVCILVS